MHDYSKVPTEFFAAILAADLRDIGPLRKLFGHFAEAVMVRLRAESVWVVREDGEARAFLGKGELWDPEVTRDFLASGPLSFEPTVVLARVMVHGRLVGAVGVARREPELGQPARRTLDRLAGILAAELERREGERLIRVLDRIRGKITSELRPRDLAYQILDSLHQLVDYDHSSAFLTWEPGGSLFRVEAEKIVWTKGKSAFVGYELPVPHEMVEELERSPGIRRLTGDGGDDPFWSLLDYHRGVGIPRPASLLCAPLQYGGEFLGLLKIAAWQRRPFDRWEESVVERFLPAASVSIRNARVNMSLERKAIQAELKATLVTLASAVAHDVNNAVGTILPLVQQMREDLSRGRVDPEVIDLDLEMVMEKARLCQRIFSNMLRVARSGRAGDGPVDLNQVVLETLPFFQGQAQRHGIQAVLDLAPLLPPVRFSRQDLQHMVLNLVNNSIDAMAEQGSRLRISTAEHDGGAVLVVEDDGPGIRADLLDKVQEPFFTTKLGGTGLGLAICRSLAWQNGGHLDIESTPGAGTKVVVELRLAGDAARVETVV